MKHFLIFLLSVSLIHCASKPQKSDPTRLYSWNYAELITRDLDEMMETVNVYIAKSRETSDLPPLVGEDPEEAEKAASIAQLQTALEFIFSRPDRDNMVSKILPRLRQELKSYDAYYSSLERIVDRAHRVISQQGHPLKDQSTAVFIFENLISQLKPRVKRDSMARAIIEKIYQLKIEIPEPIKEHRYLSSLFETHSPSEVAAQILGIKD